MSDSSNHSPLLSVQDDSFESYDPSLQANCQKTCKSSSKDVNANNANVAALVSHLSPLTISSLGKNKGTKQSAPAHASHDLQAFYTLYNGIPPNMTHALYYKLAMGLNSVVALDHKNPHTLPPNIFFFRVDGSMIPDKKSQCHKFVLGIQVTNPDVIKTTLAHLTPSLGTCPQLRRRTRREPWR
jgi:hypothetical protein